MAIAQFLQAAPIRDTLLNHASMYHCDVKHRTNKTLILCEDKQDRTQTMAMEAEFIGGGE